MPLVATEITVQVERWSDALPEMEAIFPEHWKELARFQDDIQLCCDKERYAAIEKIGALLLLTARADGRLVGYFVAFLFPHMHYKGSGLWAMSDMYYICPHFRKGAGLKLFIAFE